MRGFNFNINVIGERCEEFFSLYNATKSSVYDMCRLKIVHTRAVADNCKRIAENMGMDRYDSDMAWVIGQLHDFARFGQAVVTNSLDDSERFNHAHLGARILFVHHLIDDIIPDYDQICETDRIVMEKAVYHHSDYMLPEDLSERELLFCRIIREADQLDIFRVIAESGCEINYGCTLDELLKTDISDAIAQAFYEHRLADYSKRVTPADFHMAHIALCFGLTSESARRRALEQGYLEKMMDIEFHDPKVMEKYLGLKAQVNDFMGAC